MIKAIQTAYNGFLFRSRLEARWAVFFDALGIKYEYEAEGYDLGDLGWYLPDFWLPDAKWHVEVKPENVNSKELERAQYFDNYPPGDSMGVVFLIGQPEIPDRFLIHMGVGSPLRNTSNQAIWFCLRALGWSFHDRNEQEKLLRAVSLARSARFEHGETPVVK